MTNLLIGRKAHALLVPADAKGEFPDREWSSTEFTIVWIGTVGNFLKLVLAGPDGTLHKLPIEQVRLIPCEEDQPDEEHLRKPCPVLGGWP